MNTKSKSNVASCWTLQLNLCTKLNLQNYAVDGCCTVQNFAKPSLAQLCTQINLRCIQRPAWRVIAHTSIFAQPILRHCNHMHIQPPTSLSTKDAELPFIAQLTPPFIVATLCCLKMNNRPPISPSKVFLSVGVQLP